MNKKEIIFPIIIFIIALAFFTYAKLINRNKENITVKENNIVIENKETSFFYDVNGNKLSFEDFSGKPYVILFWKSDNAKSYEIIDLMTKYYEEYKDKINFLAINVNEPELDLNLIESVKAVNFSVPIYFDTDQKMYTKFLYEKLPEILFLNSEMDIEKEALEEIDEDAFVANLDLLIKNY